MVTKKQSSGKRLSDVAPSEAQGTSPVADAAQDIAEIAAAKALHVELIGVDQGSPDGDMSVEARIDKATGNIVDIKVIDFTALESRVAQADAAYAAAVSSVGSTADELREARAALREARGG